MVETEISYNIKTNYGRNRYIIEYENELWQKHKYHRIQKRIMVETEISQNTKMNYGRNRNII